MDVGERLCSLRLAFPSRFSCKLLHAISISSAGYVAVLEIAACDLSPGLDYSLDDDDDDDDEEDDENDDESDHENNEENNVDNDDDDNDDDDDEMIS